MKAVEPLAGRIERPYFDPLAERGLVTGQAPQLGVNALAKALENVVSNTRALGLARARWTARCSATIVFPVPVVPATRAGPLNLITAVGRAL